MTDHIGGRLNVSPAWLPDDEALTGIAAERLRYPRYGVELIKAVAQLLPAQGYCLILDAGAGDGWLAAFLQRYRPHTRVLALETYIRPGRSREVGYASYDGLRLPVRTASVDVSLLINVLHHAADPGAMLKEVARVTRKRIIIKDHRAESALDHSRLVILDVLGNLGTGAVVRGRYLSRRLWQEMFDSIPEFAAQWHHGRRYRAGGLGMLFPNKLEVVIQLDRD